MIKAIATQFRNEQNKLEAWLEYHKRQGFDTFILYDDYSDDASALIVDAWGKKHSDVRVLIRLTKKAPGEKRYENCLQTDLYEQDMDLHCRIADSFLAAFEECVSLARTQKCDGFCALIDVDEVLVTDGNTTVTEVVQQEFGRALSTMLYVPSFDVDTRGLVSDRNVFVASQTSYRWSESQRAEFHGGAFAHRGKSIVSVEHVFQSRTPWTIIHCGGCPGENAFEEAVPFSSKVNTASPQLRIHHYRIPVSRGCNDYEKHDRTAFELFLNV